MNKQRGNMYDWVTHTWNPVRGCLHDCVYCYVKSLRGYDRTPRLCAEALCEDLGRDNCIFVGSTSDIFGYWVPDAWIQVVLEKCRAHRNAYLFQTKNPARFQAFAGLFPVRSILGTTIETNRDDQGSSAAPSRWQRKLAMTELRVEKMVSIEPVMDFDVPVMVGWMREISPTFVSIGADSKRSNLPEPGAEKLAALIRELKAVMEVRLKPNLHRLLKR